ncbi:MAG: FtsX-like permease family protein [Balneolaceae bacterium]
MNPIQFISRRYLFSGKQVSLISILTFVSITGVTIGTALLIVVLSVFNGFYDVIRGFLLAYDPDIRIESTLGQTFGYDSELVQRIESFPEVTAMTPYVEGKSMLVLKGERNEVVTVRGIDRNTFLQINNLEDNIRAGMFEFTVQEQRPGLVLSDQLKNRYRLNLNDEVALLSASGMRRALTQFSAPRNIRFSLRGSYSMQQIMDTDIVYVDLMAAQRLFNSRNKITGFDLKLVETDRAEAVKTKLQSELGPDFQVSTWYDLQKPLYDVMYLEKWGSYLILMIIVLVAVLNIIGSLTMIVIQKQRDIGILISMGMTSASIKKIFRSQGLYIGLIGCGLGGVLGLGLSWLQMEYGLIRLSSAFIIDAYPVSINPVDVGIILAGSMMLCIAASWYPALRASHIQPAEAIRYE